MTSNRQSKHMYPSFMLHDLKANELNLSQSQIENLIKNSPILTQNIYRLYYEDGYSLNSSSSPASHQTQLKSIVVII